MAYDGRRGASICSVGHVCTVGFGSVHFVCSHILFKRRMFQVRLSVFSSLILVGYYIVFGVFVYVFKSRYDADFTLSWTAAFPAVGLILDYLAFRNIMKDELIVRSLDRLR